MASDFEIIVDAIHVALNEPTVIKGLFRLKNTYAGEADGVINEHSQVRRITWIPTDFQSIPLKRTNPIRDQVTGESAHVLMQEIWSVEAHIVGLSFEDMEAVRVRLLMAVRQVFGIESVANGGLWVTQEREVAAHMYGGFEKVIQRFEWTVNVRELSALTPITQIETAPVNESGFIMVAPDP